MCEQQMYFCVSCTWTDCSTRVSSLEDTFGDTGSWHGMFLGPRELNYVPVHVDTQSTWDSGVPKYAPYPVMGECFELLEVSAMHCYLAVPLSHPYSGPSATLNLPSML